MPAKSREIRESLLSVADFDAEVVRKSSFTEYVISAGPLDKKQPVFSLALKVDENGRYEVKRGAHHKAFKNRDWHELRLNQDTPFATAYSAILEKLFLDISLEQPEWLRPNAVTVGTFDGEVYDYAPEGKRRKFNTKTEVLGYELLETTEGVLVPVAIIDVTATSKTNEWGPERSLIAVSLAQKIQISGGYVHQFPAIVTPNLEWSNWETNFTPYELRFLNLITDLSRLTGNFTTDHIINRIANLLRNSQIGASDRDPEETYKPAYAD